MKTEENKDKGIRLSRRGVSRIIAMTTLQMRETDDESDEKERE